jgi:gallate decarboxylase subunit D
MENSLSRGEGRLKVNLQAAAVGQDWLVQISNENSHIGAVALGEYDFKSERASVSVMTRLGHKDDVIAQRSAYSISKATQKTVCVVAGIHLDDITPSEITRLTENALGVVQAFLKQLAGSDTSV